MDRKVLGGFELVSIPDLGLQNVVAKVDTGAHSGAIHCTDITILTDDLGETLQFVPNALKGNVYQTRSFTRRIVTSATGHSVKRYLIDTKIVVQGVEYDVTIGISDRSDLTYPVLIGRRFLLEQNMLVDVAKNTQIDPEGA